MKIGDKVYVVNWGCQYSDFYTYKNDIKEKIFDFTLNIPDYSSIEHHWSYIYEPNLTLKGTVNKREPTKLVSKIPLYKEYKYEILEIIQHPVDFKNIYLIRSLIEGKESWQQCYVIIGEAGISELTPKEFADAKFNATSNFHLGKWTSETIDRKNVPKEIVSEVYDSNDRVLFGSMVTRGKVSYKYVDAKYTKDNKPIYIGCSVLYDGKGNANLPPEAKIMQFSDIKKMF